MPYEKGYTVGRAQKLTGDRRIQETYFLFDQDGVVFYNCLIMRFVGSFFHSSEGDEAMLLQLWNMVSVGQQNKQLHPISL